MKTYKTPLVLLSSLLLAAVAAAQQPADTNAAPIRRSVPMMPVRTNGAAVVASVKTLGVGALAPDFESKDLANKAVRVSDAKQKVEVLDFWATWCGPCMRSLPHTEEVANRYKDQGVVMLAVCTSDERAKFEGWVKTNQTKYANLNFTCELHDRGSADFEERASKKLYGVSGIPTQFIIGRDGRIAAVVVGYGDGDTRLEAGLARAGIKVDPAAAAKGEEVLKQMEAAAAHPGN
jgi:thiol-disulfide isomerase/thioredoxin